MSFPDHGFYGTFHLEEISMGIKVEIDLGTTFNPYYTVSSKILQNCRVEILKYD